MDGTPTPSVLVVDDEPVIASLLEDVLTRFGYRVTVAHRVSQALDLAREATFDLCISDFLLPDRTGLDLVRELRDLRPRLRVLLITAYLEPDLAAQVEAEPGIVGVVRKPMDIFELKERVDRLTASSRSESERGHEQMGAIIARHNNRYEARAIVRRNPVLVCRAIVHIPYTRIRPAALLAHVRPSHLFALPRNHRIT